MFTENREKGASAVEFALVLPVLMVILFGIIEFGFILYDKAIVTNASREGARRGIVFYRDETGATSSVPASVINSTVASYCSNYLVSLGTGTSTPSTTITGNCSVPDSSLTVNVNYPYRFLVLPNFVGALPSAIALSGTTVMRCENHN